MQMDRDTATWMRLWRVLDQDDPDQTVYGYRIDSNGNPIRPYLFCWFGHAGLIQGIQAEYGAGEYQLLIRKGRTMLFSGIIGIGPAPRNTS
jgi:hypothetical protein